MQLMHARLLDTYTAEPRVFPYFLYQSGMQYVRKTRKLWWHSLTLISRHFCDRCGNFIIKSQVKNDINAALNAHYSKCALFDVPE
jgi:hypothetical protein